ncbi:Cysteine-rich secretory family protein [Theileria parva strain Muguga]|uniref:Cysteine-rich secretory family protein n=1 Tax=Theileria parva strain Muguga TaxID=333668 RepID=UPI001C61B04E|nr:Cysteine-rich secretory family protein [Theileria parva strain Muguga]EAN32506.2 Cysteine-rich secretory family protein [Theileria parva strain Muguga]
MKCVSLMLVLELVVSLIPLLSLCNNCHFQKDLILLAHNDYRRIHSVNSLEWNDELAKSAEKEALKITKEKCDLPLYYSELAGTNYLSVSKRLFNEGIAVQFWYEGIKEYDFDKSGVLTRNPNVLAFTQLVWKNTKFIGCGVSCCSDNIVLVCRYHPFGNIPGQFSGNVFEKFYKSQGEL